MVCHIATERASRWRTCAASLQRLSLWLCAPSFPMVCQVCPYVLLPLSGAHSDGRAAPGWSCLSHMGFLLSCFLSPPPYLRRTGQIHPEICHALLPLPAVAPTAPYLCRQNLHFVSKALTIKDNVGFFQKKGVKIGTAAKIFPRFSFFTLLLGKMPIFLNAATLWPEMCYTIMWENVFSLAYVRKQMQILSILTKGYVTSCSRSSCRMCSAPVV